jgi:hypothetical protein
METIILSELSHSFIVVSEIDILAKCRYRVNVFSTDVDILIGVSTEKNG